MRNSQLTTSLYGWWPLWTRPSIDYCHRESNI
jgi:hypothetical protein